MKQGAGKKMADHLTVVITEASQTSSKSLPQNITHGFVVLSRYIFSLIRRKHIVRRINAIGKTKGIRRINNYLLNKLTKAVKTAIQNCHVSSYNNYIKFDSICSRR